MSRPTIARLVAVTLFLLCATVRLRADDNAVNAASSTLSTADALKKAADAASRAGAAEQQAADTGLKEGNSLVQDNVDKAAAAARAADAAAKAAQQDALDASKAADEARRARQRANNGDPAGKQAALDEAKAAADKAAKAAADADKQAKAAADAAAEAEKDAKQADSDAKNLAANQGGVNIPPPPGSAQEKGLKDTKDEGKNIQDGNGPDGRKGTANGISDHWQKIESAELDNEDEQTNNENLRKPGDAPGQIPFDTPPGTFRIDSFFDVFPSIELPLLDLPKGKEGDVYLRLYNPNPFDVQIDHIDVALFGDAVEFQPSAALQQLIAGMTTDVRLGHINFTGDPGEFTAADFVVVTGGAHPGLGPAYTADFSVAVPLPGVVAASAVLLVGVFVNCRRQR